MEEACARAIAPHFAYDFADALKRSARECLAQEYAGHLPLIGAALDSLGALFSDSPLTSPEASRGSSRSTTPVPTSTYGTLPAATTSPIAPEAAPAPLTGKKARKKRQGHGRRNKQRRIEREESQKVPTKAEPRQSALVKYVKPAVPTQTAYDVGSIPSASTGFICLPDASERRPVMRLKELVNKELLVLRRWDGRSVSPIVSRNNQVIGVIAGRPAASDWDEVCQEAYEALCRARDACNFTPSAADHRRGDFLVKNVGVGAGYGRKKPANMVHTEHNARQLEALLQNPAIQRISGFANNVFATWFPKVYKHYNENLNALLKRDPDLCRNFTNSVWASTAFNFGPQTVCRAHRDFMNLPFGLCSVTALGDFNPEVSACFVFYDLGIVVQFPPGSTLILPSAAIAHANSSMSPGETRCSITQYSPGGLFRWAEHGFQLDSKYYGKLTPQAWEKEVQIMEERCKKGLSLFSTLAELKAAAAAGPKWKKRRGRRS